MKALRANFSHQKYLFNPRYSKRLRLFGAGAVGSWTALFLAKEGFGDIEVWDDDIVASHNSPMSLYGPGDVGRLKVEALREHVHRLSGVVITAVPKRFRTGDLRNSIVISCVDEMKEGRVRLWKAVKDKSTVPLFCDSRLAATYVEVISVEPFRRNDIVRYEKLLFADADAVRQGCGEHGIVYGSVNAARVIATNVANLSMGGTKTWRFAERCDTLLRVF